MYKTSSNFGEIKNQESHWQTNFNSDKSNMSTQEPAKTVKRGKVGGMCLDEKKDDEAPSIKTRKFSAKEKTPKVKSSGEMKVPSPPSSHSDRKELLELYDKIENEDIKRKVRFTAWDWIDNTEYTFEELLDIIDMKHDLNNFLQCLKTDGFDKNDENSVENSNGKNFLWTF